MTDQSVIREFVYLDLPRLYSLYSQVFQGLTDEILDETVNQLTTRDSQTAILRGAEGQSEGLEASRHVERTTLHHHMYNKLEKELDPSAFIADERPAATILEKLSSVPFLKAHGPAEMLDYDRLSEFIAHFNELGHAIGYSTMTNTPGVKAKIEEFQAKRSRATNDALRKTVQRELDKFTNEALLTILEQSNLQQDENILDMLRLMTSLFASGAYSIVITPPNAPRWHFHGVIDKGFLRYTPDHLLRLYGGFSDAALTMVGSVTHLPNSSSPDGLVPEDSLVSGHVLSPEERRQRPAMLDSFRSMFRQQRTLERMFMESYVDVEVVMSPLAIYREFSIG